MVLDDSYEVGAAGGGGAGEDEADGVSHDFQDDDPPRVAGFHSCLLSLLGVGQDGVDLLFAEFYFHDFLVLVVGLISKSGAKVRRFFGGG